MIKKRNEIMFKISHVFVLQEGNNKIRLNFMRPSVSYVRVVGAM